MPANFLHGQVALTSQTTALLLAGGQTAWHLAAKDGHTAVLQAMAEAVRSLPPHQLKQLSRFGSTADEIVTKLAQEEDTKSLTPLHLACIKGHAEAAAALMSFGVNPFVMVGAGRSTLRLICEAVAEVGQTLQRQ
jgi:ankyrin repeat protein